MVKKIYSAFWELFLAHCQSSEAHASYHAYGDIIEHKRRLAPTNVSWEGTKFLRYPLFHWFWLWTSVPATRDLTRSWASENDTTCNMDALLVQLGVAASW